MELRLINLTSHPVTLYGPDKEILLELLPDGPTARCAEERRAIGTVALPGGAAAPLHEVGFGEVSNLPAPREGVLYVVSRATAAAVARSDVVYPDDLVRDGEGRVIGCRALARAR